MNFWQLRVCLRELQKFQSSNVAWANFLMLLRYFIVGIVKAERAKYIPGNSLKARDNKGAQNERSLSMLCCNMHIVMQSDRRM